MKERRQFDAMLGIWHSMAYFVAKVLKMRPYTILTEWTCEELLVAYGVYANQQSKEAYDMKSQKERVQEHLSYLDRWAMPFFSQQDLEDNAPDDEQQVEDDMDKIASALFS